jgi:acylphosphatase
MTGVRKHLIIRGRVQGVFYRVSFQEKAFALDVTGWVKNNYDGSVEAAIEGSEESINKLINWCYHGPRGASVTDVEVTTEDFTGSFNTLSIKHGGW